MTKPMEQLLQNLQWEPLDPSLLTILGAGMDRFLPHYLESKGSGEVAKIVNRRIVQLLEQGITLNKILEEPDAIASENALELKEKNGWSATIDVPKLIGVVYGNAKSAIEAWKAKHPNREYLLSEAIKPPIIAKVPSTLASAEITLTKPKRTITKEERDLARARRKDRIVHEMANYIIANNGPDNNRYSHPTKSRTSEEYLRTALAIVKKRNPELKWLDPTHFEGVNGLYTGNRKSRNAMRRIEPVMKVLVDKYGSIPKVIEAIEQREFYDTEFRPIEGRDLAYTAKSAVEVVFQNSFKHAILHWLANNPDESIRKKYGDAIRIWHFSQVPDGTWDGDQGKALAAQACREAFESIAESRGWKNIYDVVTGITTGEESNDRLRRYQKQLSNGESISYSLQSLFTSKYFPSLTDLLGNYLIHVEDEKQDEFLRDKRAYISFMQAVTRFGQLSVGSTIDSTTSQDKISQRSLDEHDSLAEEYFKGSGEDKSLETSISYLKGQRAEARATFRALFRKVAYKKNVDFWRAVAAVDLDATAESVLFDGLDGKKKTIYPSIFLRATYDGNLGFAILDTLMHHPSEKVIRVCNWNSLSYQARHYREAV